MRKFMLLFLALLMGLSICAVVINRKFDALATEVRYNETILQGNRSAAEGVELVMNMKTPITGFYGTTIFCWVIKI